VGDHKNIQEHTERTAALTTTTAAAAAPAAM